MAHSDSTETLRVLKSFLPDWVLLKLFHTHGFLQRRSKLDPILLVWTLILGGCGPKRSLASLWRQYQSLGAPTLSRSAFYLRMNASLLDVFADLFKMAADMLPPTTLGPFEDILALDATLLRLWQNLAPRFPSTSTGCSHAKLHVLMSLKDYSPNRVKICSGTQHDTGSWKLLGPWLKDKLLFDLGYYSFWFFHRVHKQGGYFLSRLKSNCALEILEDLGTGPGRRMQVQGRKLSEVLKGLKRDHLEFVVKVPVQLRSGRWIEYHWRVIGERHEETGTWHLYLTNAPCELIEGHDARGLYALRWQVELLFKGLRQCGRLHQLPSNKEEIVKVLMYAALLFVLLSSWLRQQLLGACDPWRAPMLRSLIVLREQSGGLLAEVARGQGYPPPDLLQLIEKQMKDPNLLRQRAFDIPAIFEHRSAA